MGINLKNQDIERILQVKTRSEEYHVEKVPVADPRGTSPAPTDQNFLNFMQFLGGNLANLYVGAPSWRVGAPSYEESWIRPWVQTTCYI